MSFTIHLRTGYSPEEVQGKCAILIMGPSNALETLLNAASVLLAYCEDQHSELSVHVARLKTEGVGDELVASSLIALHRNSLQAVKHAAVLVDAFRAGAQFGPLDSKPKGPVQ